MNPLLPNYLHERKPSLKQSKSGWTSVTIHVLKREEHVNIYFSSEAKEQFIQRAFFVVVVVVIIKAAN